MLARRSLLTERQTDRLARIFSERDEHITIEVTYLVYQDIIDAYQHPKPTVGKKMMTNIIDKLRRKVPAGLEELAEAGRTLHRKREAILAYVDRDGAPNGL